ncbi:hypothetical protein ACP3P8_18230 [Pseudomonas aeruginosa]
MIRYQDCLERIRYIRQEGERRTADTTAEVAEGQVALIALAGVDEVDIGDVRPGLQRQLGLGLLLRGKGAELAQRVDIADILHGVLKKSFGLVRNE